MGSTLRGARRRRRGDDSGGEAYAAVDYGAETGRVVLGRLAGERVELAVVHRFANRPVMLPDGLRWNLLALFTETLNGLQAAVERAPLAGVGIDAWGVDYALLDERNRLLGLPYHYRDPRTRDAIEAVYARVPREELYAVTGIQHMPINTVFQLMAELPSRALDAAQRIALIPDLIALWLTGVLVNESTAASTTGLLDARTGTWARELIARLGLPAAPFVGDPVESGTAIGHALAHHGMGEPPVFAVAGHDTASAFVAAPVRSRSAAILSSGTWSLLGLEHDEPVLSRQAAEFNLTNERGADGTIRLLRNVMGLWLVQECRREWQSDYNSLNRLAAAAPADVALFDPDDDGLLAPGTMAARIGAACRRAGQRSPRDPGETVRSILTSLACKYRLVLERLEQISRRRVDCVHVVGGGARNELLCRLTADITGRTVLAGPIEAAALGNVLMQARASGRLGSLAEARALAAASARARPYEPAGGAPAADATYHRFLAVTGLSVGSAAAAAP